MEKIAIIGAGGFGRELKCLIDDINKISPKYNLIGFYDDNLPFGTFINGIEVLGGIKELNAVTEKLNIVLGVGEPKVKERIISKISNLNVVFPNLIHPSVIVSNDYVDLGKGNIICASSILTCNIKLGDFITLNLMCTVGHDTIINNFCSFMPSVNISGEVELEKGVYIGTGAKIINQLKIEENVIVGAGAVVSKSLPKNCTAVGVPAKPIKINK